MKKNKHFWRNFFVGMAVTFLLFVAAFLLWFTHDIEPFDDSSYLPPEYIPVAPEENAFIELEQLIEDFNIQKVEDNNLLIDLVQELEANREMILQHPFTQALPKRLEEILTKAHFQEREMLSFDDALPHLGPYRKVATLISTIAVEQWKTGKIEASLRTFQTLDDFTIRFGEQAPSIISVLVSSAMHGISDRARLEVLSFENLREEDLKELQNIADRQHLQRQMKTALQWEYKLSFKLILGELNGAKTWAYCENRTKAFWIDTMKPLFLTLDQKPLYIDKNITAEFSQKIENYKANIFIARNPAGRIFMTMVMPALDTAVRKIVDSYLRKDLVQIRIALERHRLQYGTYPESLDDLAPSFLTIVPKDPWTNYQKDYIYYLQLSVLYSIGYDQIDNGGDYTSSSQHGKSKHTLSSNKKDFGLYITEPQNEKK